MAKIEKIKKSEDTDEGIEDDDLRQRQRMMEEFAESIHFDEEDMDLRLAWDSEPPDIDITLEYTDFNARGMRCVYGRSDRFPRQMLSMDIWKTRDGRLFMRFWSRCKETDWYSYEIKGMDLAMGMIPPIVKGQALSDTWVPKAVRDEYEGWVISELHF